MSKEEIVGQIIFSFVGGLLWGCGIMAVGYGLYYIYRAING